MRIHLAVGNHASHAGIGEVLFTMSSYFKNRPDRFEMTASFDLVPGVVNVVIDEFSVLGAADYFRDFKRLYRETKIVVIATEFITKASFFGLSLGKTFNHFNSWEDRRLGAAILAYSVRCKKTPPYMHRRYLGFVDMLGVTDLLIAVHPVITESLNRMAGEDPVGGQWATPAVTVYPELDVDKLAKDRRLTNLPVGFDITGTLTPYRRLVVNRLVQCGQRTGIDGVPYQALPFEQKPSFRLRGGAITFLSEAHYEMSDRWDLEGPHRIYNLNPPQRGNWPYSSPMRILRGLLHGQIPVVTRRFNDHPIEDVARLWDTTTEAFRSLWMTATVGRERLIRDHIRSMNTFAAAAREGNHLVTKALETLDCRT